MKVRAIMRAREKVATGAPDTFAYPPFVISLSKVGLDILKRMVSVEYLASFIDGEGSLSLSRIPRGQSYHEYCVWTREV